MESSKGTTDCGKNGGETCDSSKQFSLVVTEKQDQKSEGYRAERPVFNQPQFDADFDVTGIQHQSASQHITFARSKCHCNSRCIKKNFLHFFPFIPIMKAYNIRAELVNDIIGGLTVGVMHIPQGMAYALLASVAPVYGLYVSFFPVILYFFFGTSRHGSIGTFSLSSLLVAACLAKANCPEEDKISLYNNVTDMNNSSFSPSMFTHAYDQNAYSTDALTTSSSNASSSSGISDSMQCRMEVATALAFMTGLIQMGMGFLRLGFLTNYLSYPMTRGFTTGAATHIFSAQMKNVFGIKLNQYSGAGKLLFLYHELFSKITNTTIATLLITVICIVILWCFKEYIAPRLKKVTRMPIPIDLIVVIIATVASYFGNFDKRFHVKILEDIPTGIPPPKIPDMSRIGFVIVDAIPLAIICFTVSFSVAKVFAAKHGYKVDANQELVAYGVCNTACSFLNCFSTCFSLSRSCVQEGAGGGTQIVGLVSSVLIFIVLLFLAPLFEPLPTCVLAAIIIVALKGMFMQLTDLKDLWTKSKIDLSVWLVAFISTVLFDVVLGLVIGVIYSLVVIICMAQNARATILGIIDNTDMYEDVAVCSQAREIPGIKIFRYEGSLFFANQKQYFDQLYTKTGCNAVKLLFAQNKVELKKQRAEKKMELQMKAKSKEGADNSLEYMQGGWVAPKPAIHHLILDCSMIASADSTGVSTLQQVVSDFKKINVKVTFASCRAGLRDTLEVGGFFEKIDRSIMFPALHDAVLAAVSNESPLRHKLSNLYYGIDSYPNNAIEPTEGLLTSSFNGHS